MSGIVGRLFREFALTLTFSVAVSALVSLTLTPMMCARLLKPESQEKHGRFYHLSEKYFNDLLNAYDRSLKWVLHHHVFTMIVAAITLVATIWLYILIPKGLLPQQDTGMVLGFTDAAQSISFKNMASKQRVLSEIVARDPDMDRVASFVGAGSVNPTMNSGRLYIMLKPRDARKSNASQIIDRLRESTRNVEGISLFMQAAQDVQIESRVSRTQYQYTLQDADEDGTGRLGKQNPAKVSGNCQISPTSRPTSNPVALRLPWISTASLPPDEHRASSDRRHALRCIRPAPGLDDLHATQSISCHSRSRTALSNHHPKTWIKFM